MIAAAIGKVAVDRGKGGIFGNDGPAFLVKLWQAQAKLHRERRFAAEQGRAAVALFHGAVPKGMVALRLGHLDGQLVGLRFGFLQAQNIRPGVGQPGQKALFVNGAYTVDIPGEESNRMHKEPGLLLQLNCQSPAGKSDFVACFELFLTPGFDDAVQLHFTPLDNQLGLAAGADQALPLQKLIELDVWFALICHDASCCGQKQQRGKSPTCPYSFPRLISICRSGVVRFP